jgi:hypothetical protein
MPKKKYDGIIEVVRYTPEGKIDTVRMYERRGPTFSDRLMFSRAELLQRLRAGKKIAVGMRKEYLAGTFDITSEVHLSGSRSQEMIVSGQSKTSDRDDLQGAPLF